MNNCFILTEVTASVKTKSSNNTTTTKKQHKQKTMHGRLEAF